jgi:hypothetical protein
MLRVSMGISVGYIRMTLPAALVYRRSLFLLFFVHYTRLSQA